jgi:opacity protein-like surface antigen
MEHNFALNALVGLSFELGPQSTIEVGYLYADYGKSAGLKAAPHMAKFAMRSHNIFLGARYEL